MSCAAEFCAMSNVLKLPSTSQVIEHGLLVGVVLVLMNAAITLETLEMITGMIGALAVCIMKQNASRKSQKSCSNSGSGNKIASCLQKAKATTQFNSADETCPCDEEFVQLRACVQAELNVLRAECKLQTWKNKTDQAEVELVHLHGRIAEIERDLSQQDSTQPWTDQPPQTRVEDLFGELMEAKLRAEEVEAELMHAQTSMADLENEIAEATSVQSRAEEAAQMRIEALSTELAYANDRSAIEMENVNWMNEDF